MMKNHEGYHDPTAGKAIRRAHRAKRRGRGEQNATFDLQCRRSARVPGDNEIDIVCCLRLW